MIRSRLLIAAAIVVSGVLTACSDTATGPKSRTVGIPQVVTRSGTFLCDRRVLAVHGPR